ncbi:adenylate/guanylate cyclase domain-containing protein [Pikeienuella sp. HZG-20]|uniref:CHASE2 domain-containing protein n=1 Tax=Paludibacillus litoralis TaxID=3133267 RepID=UPI0030EDEE61
MTLQIADPAGLRAVNEAAFDQYQRWKPRQVDPSVPVAVVDIDVRSLQALGQWPWPRTEMAALTRRLADLGALAIAFDVVFAEPDRTSPDRVLKDWRKYDPAAEIKVDETLHDNDAVFAAAIAETPTVLGVVLNNDPDGVRPPTRAGVSYSGSDPRPVIPNFASANVNLPLLSHSASGIGNFSLGNERADIIRRVPLLTRVDDQIVPTLALEAIRVGFQAGSILIKSNDASREYGATGAGIASMRVGPMEVPVEPDGGLYIYYSGDSVTRADRVVSAMDILAEGAPDPALAERIAGKVVFVGTSAPGLLDLVATPFEPAAAGVNVHAELAEEIIARFFQTDRIAYRDELRAALPALEPKERLAALEKISDLEAQIAKFSEPVFISKPDWGEGLERIFIVLIGALASLLLAYNRTILAGVVAMLGVIVVGAASWFAFDLSGFLLGPVYPALGVFAPWGTLTVYNYVRTDRDKRAVRNQFAHFMSPEVIEQIADDPQRYLTPGGDLRPLSIMFCDVRRFSTITEKMSPQETIQFINEFLTPLSEVVIRNNGTIDKYMGDCIMAFWNAPRESPMHMEQATLSLFQFRAALVEINRKFVSIGFPEIDIGVGVNTGPCAVGAMGSKSRLDYSCIGDAVNLASRLEGITKQYGLWNCIGDTTATGVRESFALIQIDQVAVKGRSKPETIWTVAGEADVLSDPDFLAIQAAVEEGLAAYKAQDWDRAEAAYRRAGAYELDAFSPKGLVDVFLGRIAEYRAAPPPADWDGVYVATSK